MKNIVGDLTNKQRNHFISTERKIQMKWMMEKGKKIKIDKQLVVFEFIINHRGYIIVKRF